MQIQVEDLNSYSKKLKIQLTAEDLGPIEKKVLRDYQRQADIHGFRRGHAPLSMVRKRYESMIQQDILEEAMKEYYEKALDEAKIDPVGQGKITDLKFEDAASGMSFDLEVEVEPEFELKKYKGLKVEKDIIEITDEMVDDSLQQLREQYATVKDVEEAREGHHVHFDVQELDQGDVPILGHKYENLEVELGSGKFDPQIESQLVGIKPDEKRIVRQEVPPAPDVNTQEPVVNRMEIHAKKIEEKEYPELDDEFVKNLNDEKLDNMDQLRERVRENMKLEFQRRSEQNFNNRLIDELLKENPFEVPPTMVDHYLDEMVKDFKKQSQGQEIQEDLVKKEYRASAVHNIRWHFLRKKLVEVENITASDEEAFKLIDEAPAEEKIKEQAKADQHYLGHLKEDIAERKVLDLLKEHAEVVEVYPLKQGLTGESTGDSGKAAPEKKKEKEKE